VQDNFHPGERLLVFSHPAAHSIDAFFNAKNGANARFPALLGPLVVGDWVFPPDGEDDVFGGKAAYSAGKTLMERTGVEPVTSALQRQRSPN